MKITDAQLDQTESFFATGSMPASEVIAIFDQKGNPVYANDADLVVEHSDDGYVTLRKLVRPDDMTAEMREFLSLPCPMDYQMPEEDQ